MPRAHPDPAQLIIGVIARDEDLLAEVRPALEAEFGPVEDASPVIPFDFTSYYNDEMGYDLIRVWYSFADLQPLEALTDIKNRTNALETNWRMEIDKRSVNLDPGLLTQYNFVLATTKNYSHRVYLHNNVFAEVTLIYEHGEFRPLRWTYPDYQSPVALEFLKRARDRYLTKLHQQSQVTGHKSQAEAGK